MKKVFIAGPIPEKGLEILKAHFEVEMYEGEGIIDKETLKTGVKDAFGLVSLLSTEVDQEVIDSGSNLQFIANYGAVSIMSMSIMHVQKISMFQTHLKPLQIQRLN